jgi:hypothetical protein
MINSCCEAVGCDWDGWLCKKNIVNDLIEVHRETRFGIIHSPSIDAITAPSAWITACF